MQDVYRRDAGVTCFIGSESRMCIEVMQELLVLSGPSLGEDEQQEQGEVISQNTSNRKKICAKKNKATSIRDDAPVFVDVVKLKGNMLMPNKVKKKVTADEGKKVVEKVVSSKKAKKVAVESKLVHEDALASADEEEKVAGGNKRKKDVNEGNKVVGKLMSSKKVKKVADVSEDDEEAETVERNKKKINDAPNKAIKKVAGGNKRKKDANEGKKVEGKLVSFKKLKQVADGSELDLVDNEKGIKYYPVKINTRMSPSHLKNVLNTCTLTQIMDLNELGLGHFHNNFDFESTPGELGMWVVKSYDHETHTLRMGDGRRIKVSRELIHEILGVPMGENKVISLPSTTSEDKTTTDWRYTTPFTEDRIHITRVDDHVSSLTANGWPFKVGFLVVFFSILAQGNKDGTVNQRFIPTLRNIDEFQNYDWCQFILDCIKAEVMEFKPRSYFAGPLLLLALIYVSSTVSPTTTVERKAPIFKAWSTKLLKKRESEELKSGGFGKLPILEGLEFIEPKKPKLKKKKSEVLLLGDGSMSREQELEEFKTKTSKDMKDCLNDNVSKIKALMLDTCEKLKIALNEYPKDSDLKMILGKRLGFFKELYRRDVDNAMVVLHKDNDLSEEAVKDNEVLKEKDYVPEKGNDIEKVVELGGKKKVQEMNKEKDVEKVVDQDLDKHEDIEKEREIRNNEVEKKIEDLIKGAADVRVEISKKGVSKGVLAIYEENHEPVKNYETLEEADFPSIGLEDIKSLKVKNNDGIAQCMKEKSIYEEKGKRDNFKGGHPTVKRQQIKKAMEGEKNVPKTRAKKTDAYKQDIKKPQVRKQTAAQLAKSKEKKAKTVKPAPTKRKKKEPNVKEENAIHASPISFIPPTVDSESEKR
ncbi:hypothetical protein Tco_0844559 [Tanacetum coccineum]